jgi:hypothetical protein
MSTTLRARSSARAASIIAIGIGVLAVSAQSVLADLYDAQTVTNNTGNPQTQMNLTFSGDVAGDIDATVNPFGSGGSQQITYDSNNNTTQVTFSGAAIAANASAMYGLSFTNASFEILDSYWDTETDAFPSLSVTASSMSETGPTYYSLFFTELSFGGTPVDDMYEELPTPGGCGQFEMNNNIGDSVDSATTFDTAVGGSWITWPIPLDELNETDTPPVGPIFWPVSAPAEVAEGDSFEEEVCVPEPTAGLLSVVAGSLVALRRHRPLFKSCPR